MLWITKRKFNKALQANGLIHDTIVMGVADKYIKEEDLKNDDFGLLLLGRSLNWAIPRMDYDIKNDIDKVENEEFKKQFVEDENEIFSKGLNILNADPLLEMLVTFYITYQIYLLDALYPKDSKKRFIGMKRMSGFLAQTLEKQPDISSKSFIEDYKNLFVKFNNTYGKYGKVLKTETIDSLFSMIHARDTRE